MTSHSNPQQEDEAQRAIRLAEERKFQDALNNSGLFHQRFKESGSAFIQKVIRHFQNDVKLLEDELSVSKIKLDTFQRLAAVAMDFKYQAVDLNEIKKTFMAYALRNYANEPDKMSKINEDLITICYIGITRGTNLFMMVARKRASKETLVETVVNLQKIYHFVSPKPKIDSKRLDNTYKSIFSFGPATSEDLTVGRIMAAYPVHACLAVFAFHQCGDDGREALMTSATLYSVARGVEMFGLLGVVARLKMSKRIDKEFKIENFVNFCDSLPDPDTNDWIDLTKIIGDCKEIGKRVGLAYFERNDPDFIEACSYFNSYGETPSQAQVNPKRGTTGMPFRTDGGNVARSPAIDSIAKMFAPAIPEAGSAPVASTSGEGGARAKTGTASDILSSQAQAERTE